MLEQVDRDGGVLVLVDTEHREPVVVLVDALEGDRRAVAQQQRHVGHQAAGPLVAVSKGLQVRDLNPQEEGRLDRIADRLCLLEDQGEQLAQPLRILLGLEASADDVDTVVTDPALIEGIRHQPVHQEVVDREHQFKAEALVRGRLDHVLDGALVIKEHPDLLVMCRPRVLDQ